MRLHENAGFGEPLSPELVEALEPIAHGIRTGIAVNGTHEHIEAVVGNAAEHFGESTFIVGGWDWLEDGGALYQRRDADLFPMRDHLARQCESIFAVWTQRGRPLETCWIEVGNELDGSYWKEHLSRFHQLALFLYRRVRELSPSSPFITGSTMNLNKGALWKRDGFEVLEELCRLGWPGDSLQGLHPYRQKDGRGWPSFVDDNEALEELRRILRGRRVAITEMGWQSKRGFSDRRIADFMREEIICWELAGAACFDHYQVQDAPKPNNEGEGGFGAYSAAGDGLEAKPLRAELVAAKERLKHVET